MFLTNFHHWGYAFCAYFLRILTTRVEAATGRWVYWAWHLTAKHSIHAFSLRVWNRYCIKQCLCVWVGRIVEQGLFISNFNDMAQIHYCKPVADMVHNAQVMRNK